MIVVATVGTSSITRETGEIDEEAIGKFCTEVVTLRRAGHRVGPAARGRDQPRRFASGEAPAAR